MSLTTDIKSIVNTKLPDATYTLKSWFNANHESFDIEAMTLAKPFIVLNNEIPKDKEVGQNANTLSNSKIIMQFLVKGNVYETDDDMNTDIEALEIIAGNIMNIISQLEEIRYNNNENFRYKITPRFKIYNSVLVGVEAEARVKQNQLIPFCKNP